MNRKTTLLILSVFLSFSLFAANVTISGYLTDRRTGETLISGSVYDYVSGKGAISNVYGFYSLTLPQGRHDLRYTYVGYQMENRSFVLNQDTTIHISLEPSNELQEVTILGSSRQEFGVLGAQMGAVEVPVTQIKAVPAMFGETDVIKALQLLPGVQGGTEGSAGMYVRGGGPDENLLLLDGVPVYNVNHMGGFFSVFNADALKNVTLYKGNFPARFGGRLSSVVDIRMNDGNAKEYHGNVSVGAISSKFNLEGPIIKDKTTFNVSYRRTYADLLLQPVLLYVAKTEGNDGRYKAGYYFYDLNVKVTHKISDQDKLFLSVYSGDDAIYAKIKDEYSWGGATNSDQMSVDWNWGNTITALRWNHVVNSKLFMNTTAAFTRYRFDMTIGEEQVFRESEQETQTNMEVGYNSGIRDYSWRTEFDYTPFPGHDVKFGANYVNHTFRPGISAARFSTNESNGVNIDTTFGDKNVFANEVMLYAEDNLSLGSFLKANVGLNYSLFNVEGVTYQALEPRLSTRLLISDQLSFKAGLAGMSQFIHLLSNSSLSLPTDLWVPVTKRIVPMKSWQYSAGLFYNLNNWADLSVEGYYKSMDNLIEYKDGAGFLGSNTGWEDKVAMGRGWAYGLEFLAQRTVGKTTGWLAYTWSKAMRQFDRPGQVINNGKPFHAKYDRRHDISLTLNHRFSERFELAGTWVYCTGNNGTLAYQQYQMPVIPDYYAYWGGNTIDHISERNNYRLPAYHRMDLSFSFHKQKKHGMRTWNISFYNAYNRLNPFLVYQGYSDDQYEYDETTHSWNSKKALIQVSIFPIIPSISYTYKF